MMIEPEKCKDCGSKESMEKVTAEVNGVETEGWLCQCGHFHFCGHFHLQEVIMEAKTIEICAKCSDMFSAVVKDEKGKKILDYDGYVPTWFPAFKGEPHFGDYVMLEIDLATGKILNWKAPKQKDLDAMKPEKEIL